MSGPTLIPPDERHAFAMFSAGWVAAIRTEREEWGDAELDVQPPTPDQFNRAVPELSDRLCRRFAAGKR